MKMRLDRLETLAKHLETVPPETFNLKAWKCGTTACAMGHACSIPKFRQAGLKLTEILVWMTEPMLSPEFKGRGGFEAAEFFFGLNEDEALFLFDPDCYPAGDRTRKQTVINRIRKFIAKHQGVKA